MFDRIIVFFEDHPMTLLAIIFIIAALLSGLTGEMHHI